MVYCDKLQDKRNSCFCAVQDLCQFPPSSTPILRKLIFYPIISVIPGETGHEKGFVSGCFSSRLCLQPDYSGLADLYCRHNSEGGRTFRAVKLSSSRDRCSKSAPAGIKHTTFSLLTLEQNSKEVSNVMFVIYFC